MSVDVVIVAYNSGHWLKRAVLSALMARGVARVIVVDNASSDGSVDIIKHLDRVLILPQSENLGFGRACNLAVRHSQANYLLLLNPDCELANEDVMRLQENFSEDVALVSAQLLNADGSAQATSLRFDPSPARLWGFAFGAGGLYQAPPQNPRAVAVEACSGALMMIKRTIFEAIGGFDEGYFLHWEDLDLCKRLRMAGFQLLVDTRIRVRHDKGTSSQNMRAFVARQKYLGMLRYYQKFYAKTNAAPARLMFKLGAFLRYQWQRW